jgi:hypothetical protein
MLPRVLRTVAASAALAGILLISPTPAAGQQPVQAPGKAAAPRPPSTQITAEQMAQALAMQQPSSEDAQRTRDQFMDLLRRYSPSVGRVFKIDPTLLTNPDYMSAYPAVTAFLVQHPEITRNPSFYLEPVRFSSDSYETPRSRSYDLMRNMMDWVGGLAVATIIVSTIVWLIRSLIDYRRWIRLSKVQTEAHTKLVDRFTQNEELLAYVQSPAGAKFLESAPIALDPGARRVGAPFSRILWSAQAGMVLLAGGIGLRYVSLVVTDPEAVEPFMAMGLFGMAIGLGFVVSAGVSYVLSKHLGLFNGSARPDNLGAGH